MKLRIPLNGVFWTHLCDAKFIICDAAFMLEIDHGWHCHIASFF